MPRYPHYLRPVKKAYWPATVLVIDCESEIVSEDMRSNSYREGVVQVHWCQLRLEAYGYVYAGCDSDSTPSRLWERIAQLTKGGKCLHVFCYHATRVWTLVDLWQRLESGLLTLSRGDTKGKAVEFPKRPTDQDGFLVLRDPPMMAALYHKETGARITLWDARNHGLEIGDAQQRGGLLVHYLCDWLTRYNLDCGRYDLGGLQLTAGSQALHGYRKGYYHSGVYCHASDEVLRMEASGYHGGRVEAYRLGPQRDRLHYADERSCYTGVCSRLSIPARLCGTNPNPDFNTWRRAVESGAALVQCTVRLEEPAYPYRSARAGSVMAGSQRENGSSHSDSGDTDTCYPVGRFRTVLAGPEALDALEHGYIEDVHWLATYECEPIFKDFAEALHAWRLECDKRSDKDMSRCAKLIANCFAGKWGQHKRCWIPDTTDTHGYAYGEWYGADERGQIQRYRTVGGQVQRDSDEGLAPDANLAIAAWITSAARIRLLNLIRRAGWEHVAYCDTDALMVDDVGLSRLEIVPADATPVLGSTGVRWTSEQVVIHSVKHYSYDQYTVCAGLPRGLVRDEMDGATYTLVPNPERYVYGHERPQSVTEVRSYDDRQNRGNQLVYENGLLVRLRVQE
jgi:hypothetical protein